jgi:hypothetical protein
MEISKFNNSLMYSNKNLEKLIRKVINESSNAVLLETFTDKCILQDHITGGIYSCDYDFDGKVLTFENFEQIELEKDSFSLKEAIEKMFDDEYVDIVEEYENASMKQDDVYENSLVEALSSKNMSNVIDYTEMLGISESVSEELKETKMFKIYENRLEEKPTNSIKYIDWENTVKVSIIDEDENNFIVNGMKEKASKLKSNTSFKEELLEAASEFIETEDCSLLESLIEENREVAVLDKSEVKEVVGVSVITNKTLLENRNKIVDEICRIIEENENLMSLKESAEGTDGTEDKDAQCTEEDYDKLLKELEKVQEKVSDEKLSKKIEDLISAINDCKDTDTTDVATVKEAISLLKM